MYRKFKPPFFLAGVISPGPGRCQPHECLVEIALLRDAHKAESHAQIKSLTTQRAVHIRSPFFCSSSSVGLNCILPRLNPTRRDCCVVQFNLSRQLSFSPSTKPGPLCRKYYLFQLPSSC